MTALPPSAAISRRQALRVGGLSLLGLTLPDLLRAREATPERRRGAKSCLFVFLQGGPSHLDSLDPKPDGTAEVRGEFASVPTKVPGTRVCELLPRLASLADRYALIRSCTHDDTEHNSAAHCALTGRMHPRKGQIVPPSADDFPPFGASLAKLRPSPRNVPAWVTLPAYLINSGVPFPSQNAGFLGGSYDPFAIRSDPNRPTFAVQGLSLGEADAGQRLDDRRALRGRLDALARGIDESTNTRTLDHCYARAFDLILSPAAHRAFSLATEPTVVRERYGRTPFGQSLLLSRRLVEAGVPLVTVYYTNETPRRPGCAISWDTHEDNFIDLKNKLLPDLDRALSALLEDLAARGLLDETLVVVAGEFGRTPTINKDAGRDHWTQAYTGLWAGGGVKGGLVYGASDRHGALPARQPVTPAALAATLFHALGVDPQTEIFDRQARPHALTLGEPILGLFG